MAEKPEPTRPLPSLAEPDTEPFWRATADERLTYPVCDYCGTLVFYPRRTCTGCVHGDLRWRESAGLGRIYTFTVIRQNGSPYFRAQLPYVLAYVDLDEGFRMLTEVVAAPEEVRVGQRVQLRWAGADGTVKIPVFAPAGDGLGRA
ncbi:MAG TPA: OB-fold domain-containing protein [Pseudonocardia sp.]|jgi:hypothetical protein